MICIWLAVLRSVVAVRRNMSETCLNIVLKLGRGRFFNWIGWFSKFSYQLNPFILSNHLPWSKWRRHFLRADEAMFLYTCCKFQGKKYSWRRSRLSVFLAFESLLPAIMVPTTVRITFFFAFLVHCKYASCLRGSIASVSRSWWLQTHWRPKFSVFRLISLQSLKPETVNCKHHRTITLKSFCVS